MTFRIVDVGPDSLTESLNCFVISSGHLVRISEVSESRGTIRIDSYRLLEVKNSFIVAVMLGKQYSHVVVRQPVPLHHGQRMGKQVVTVLPVADLRDGQRRE